MAYYKGKVESCQFVYHKGGNLYEPPTAPAPLRSICYPDLIQGGGSYRSNLAISKSFHLDAKMIIITIIG